MKNLDYKDIVGKLMSQENISVVHRQHYPTAAFDLESRTLFLPEFANLSENVYDLLIGHEVSHALNTPKEGWHTAIDEKGANFKSFLNVVEDARIERMIQDKFPGLKSSFKIGYKELFDNDFFGVQSMSKEELQEMLLIDRLNLHSKLGELNCGVEFTQEEREYIKEMSNLKTWEDVVSLAEKLFEYCKEEKKRKEEEKEKQENGEGEPKSSTDKSQNIEFGDSGEDEQNEKTEEKQESGEPQSLNEENSDPNKNDFNNDLPFSETDKNFRDKEDELYNREEPIRSWQQSTSLDLPVVQEKYFYDDWRKIEKGVRDWMKKAEEYNW